MSTIEKTLYEHLAFIYGKTRAVELAGRFQSLLDRFSDQHAKLASTTPSRQFSEQDILLITYGDMVQEEHTSPLRTLANFLEDNVHGFVSAVHILPFYPFSSDDGFSVIDYRKVDPRLGGWEEITRLGENFNLMFDAVINHISAQSAWFQGFVGGDERYKDYFVTVPEGTDISQVFRPRTLPLLTPVETPVGEKLVWTTFSADQVDLNYANPEVLLAIVDLLLFYVEQGAKYIRLDAIAFLWKEIGTASLHLPKTHRIIQLFRTVLDAVAPEVVLITETNVPHKENVAYFGDGTNEAQMVYNFSLPPLVLHAFHRGNAEVLSQWAASLSLPSDRVTFFNFLASHDGIGVTPARGLLGDGDIDRMAKRVEALGGCVSYKNDPDGSQSAYELNINYLDALGNPGEIDESIALVAQRFLASQAIMLALRGVPGIYFHSLFGSHGWPGGVEHSGRKRTINRQKLVRSQLERELIDPNSLRKQVFKGYRKMLVERSATTAFHPNGEQRILHVHEAVFVVLRVSPDGLNKVLCLHNVSHQSHEIVIDLNKLHLEGTFVDLIGGEVFTVSKEQLRINIAPYQVLWMQPRELY